MESYRFLEPIYISWDRAERKNSILIITFLTQDKAISLNNITTKSFENATLTVVKTMTYVLATTFCDYNCVNLKFNTCQGKPN